jgi:glycosyltransferase involved in cell wall biosynthesis
MSARHNSGPAVSVCIPTYNGARYLGAALRSAVVQTFEDLEITVVDGGSTDATVEVARSIDDPRIHVTTTGRNDGMVANWNRTIELSRGRLIKFLFQDDLLAPDCVERMVGVFDRSESVGLVFSPREIIVDHPDDEYTRIWLEQNGDLQRYLGPLPEVSRGRDIVMHHAGEGFESNRIGEPTCVMIRRSTLERIGAFNLRMHQSVDVEMWLRVLYQSYAGYIDEPLATFRLHAGAATSGNLASGKGWLDRLWLIEGMLQLPDLEPDDRARFRRMRGHAMRRTARQEASRVKHRLRPSVLSDGGAVGDYVRYRVSAARGHASALHGRID